MTDQIAVFVEAGRREKAMRWLGFAQGVIWSRGLAGIDTLKDHNRPAANDPEEDNYDGPDLVTEKGRLEATVQAILAGDGFNVGDVVVLQSGGCPMTVSGYVDLDGESCVATMWFNVKDQLKRGIFPSEMLILVDGFGADS
jgi:uncharacterized protein YodC (DUF2158 family)